MSAHPSPTPMAPSSDDILAALDPEQREVAAAPTGPDVRARRCGHRQDPGDHPPDRVRRATGVPTSRSGCSRSPSPPGRPARCAPGCASSASAGCRPAPSTPPRCASCTTSGRRRSAARAPRGAAAQGRGWSPRPAARLRLPARPDGRARPGRRDRVGQGQHADRPRPTAAAARRAGRDPAGLDATADGPAARGLRGGQGRARASSTSRTCCCVHGRHPRRARGHRRAPSASSTATSSSTSTRTSTPLQQRLLDLWLGERDDLCVVGDAGPDDLLVHRRLARGTCSGSRAATRRPRWSSWSATTAPRRRSSAWPTSCCCARARTPARSAAAAGGAASRRPRRRQLTVVPRRPGRGGRRRRARSPS